MTETTIKQLPDGRWQLLQVYDDWDELAASVEAMDLDAEWGPEVRVETTPRTEPARSPFYVGAKGKTRDGCPYEVVAIDAAAECEGEPQPIHARITTPRGSQIDSFHCADGRFLRDSESPRDLMPPDESEPWDGLFRESDRGVTRDGRPYLVTRAGSDSLTVVVACAHGAWHETTLHARNGRFSGLTDHGRDLLPPTKRGPKV